MNHHQIPFQSRSKVPCAYPRSPCEGRAIYPMLMMQAYSYPATSFHKINITIKTYINSIHRIGWIGWHRHPMIPIPRRMLYLLRLIRAALLMEVRVQQMVVISVLNGDGILVLHHPWKSLIRENPRSRRRNQPDLVPPIKVDVMLRMCWWCAPMKIWTVNLPNLLQLLPKE